MDRDFLICRIFVQQLKLGLRHKKRETHKKLKVPDQIINESKEEFIKAKATDANLENIRRRVEDGNVTVSRGLNRDETKFV